MVSFRDPIHGDLFFTGILEELIATEEFQRLSEVKQLGLTDKVYPGANHTRFSHALGVCYVAGEIARKLGVPEHDQLLLQIAALLHDIGHYDFSHAIEDLAPYNHEENGARILRGEVELPGRKSGEIARVLRSHGIEPQIIIDLLHRGGAYPAYYYSILSSKVIDSDRMDYLKRDSYYAGAVIGEIDIDRLLQVLVVHPETKELGIQEKGVASLEQFLVARMHMHQQVYRHPQSYIGEGMLRTAVAQSLDVARPLLYGDAALLTLLLEHGTACTKELVQRIRAGKRAFYDEALIVDETGTLKHLVPNVRRLSALESQHPGTIVQALEKASGVAPGTIVVAFPARTHKPAVHPRFPVLLREGQWADLWDISPLVRIVFETHISKVEFGVYTPAECTHKVHAAALELLERT